MFVVRFSLFVACATLVLGVANAQEVGPARGTVNPPQINAKDAMELAEWARQQAQQSAGNPHASGITAQDVKMLQGWAQDQASGGVSQRASGPPQQPPAHNPRFVDRYSGVAPAVPQSQQTRPLLTTGQIPNALAQFQPRPRTALGPNPTSPVTGQALQTGAILKAQATEAAPPAATTAPEQLDSGEIRHYDSEGNEIFDDGWGWGCCGKSHGCIGGVEGLFMAPISEPTQQVTLTNLLTNGAATGTADPGFGAGVRAWLGMEHCGGWGYRARYTHFGNCALRPDPVVPVKSAASAFNQSYYLNMDIVDLEITQRFKFCHFETNVSIGGRYARLERNATVVGYGTQGGVDLVGLAVGANEMEGSGLTFSIGGLCPISLCNCCGWNVIGNFRGSVLWADASGLALTDAGAVIKSPVSAQASSRNQASASTAGNSETLFVAEAQLGLEYQRPLRCHRAVLFFRAVAEYQHWQTGDISATSSSYAFLQGSSPDFGGRVDATSSATDGDLDLIGFTLGTGITY